MNEYAVRGIANYLSSYTLRHSYRNTTQHGPCHITMLQLMQRVVAIMLLAFVCGEVRAGDYVFYNGTVYMAINNSGTLVTSTSFDPTTCIWSGTSGGKFYCNGHWLGQNSSYVPIADGPSYYNTTINTSGYIVDGSKWYYNYNSGAFSTTSSQKTYSFKAYEIETVDAVLPTLTISSPASDGSSYIGSVGGTMTISANISGGYHPKYHKFNNSYYLEDGTYYGTTPPSTTNNHNLTYELVGECVNYATISGHTVTYTADAGYDVVAQVKVTAKPQGKEVIIAQGTCNFVLYSAKIAAPTITRIEGTNQYQITSESKNVSIKYTIDGTDINQGGSNGSSYSAPITITTSNTVIKAKCVRGELMSKQTAYTVTDILLMPPTINITDAGVVSISHNNTFATNATIRFTSDGSTPSATSNVFTSLTVNNMMTVKAIVIAEGYVTSSVSSSQYKISSGISDGVVTLNDYEDHNWTYYKGADIGNYNTNFAGKLYSPNPRNVKITYNGNGGAVSISESETKFVYYKTLEESATTGEYKYQVISNPFSKRPKVNGKVQGFGGWKIISGGDYIKGKSNGNTLGLDEEIIFEDLPYTEANCTSAEVELQATWVNATVKYGASNISSADFKNGNYETNLLVLNGNSANNLAPSYPITIMMVEPDGSKDYRNEYIYQGHVTPVTGIANTTKLEYVHWDKATNLINAAGRNFTIGRGMIMPERGTSNTLYLMGTYNETGANHTFKVESGYYTKFYGNYGSVNINKQILVLGCDYDRAKSDNSKLTLDDIFLLFGTSQQSLGFDNMKCP